MFNLRKRTKISVFIFAGLYLLVFAISAFDFRGNMSNLFCGIITSVVALAAISTSVRAYVMAKRIEHAKRWHSNCCCRGSAIQVAMGFAIWTAGLGLLKIKSIISLFIDHWHELPTAYHLNSWAYLAENAMGLLLAWVVLNMLQAKHDCAQIKKTITRDTIILHK